VEWLVFGILKVGQKTLGWDKVYSCISEKNEASINLAEKLGATLDRTLQHDTRGTILIYRHAR